MREFLLRLAFLPAIYAVSFIVAALGGALTMHEEGDQFPLSGVLIWSGIFFLAGLSALLANWAYEELQ